MLTLIVAVLVAVPLVIVSLLVGFAWWPAILVGLVLGALITLRATMQSFARVSDWFGPVEPADHPRLENLVEGLSLSIGVSEPNLFILTDPALNAAVVADGESSSLIATSGLLASLDLMQLEGVVAELLVKIKNGDAKLGTSAASLVGPFIDGPLANLAGPFGARALGSAIDSEAEMLADQAAVAVTRYPPALGSALATLEQKGFRPVAANKRNGHLWLASPLTADAVVECPPLEWRVDMLSEIS